MKIINFTDAVTVINSQAVLKRDYKEEGTFPIISQEAELINGYTDESSDLVNGEEGLIGFGDHTKTIKYIDFEFVKGADGLKVLKVNKEINPKYFYFWIKSLNLKDLGYARHFKLLKHYDIPVPSLQEQEKIVERLDKVFKHISTQIKNINTQVDLNSLIFESYFEKIQSNFMNSGTISEFFDLATGGTPSKKNKEYFNNGRIPWLLSGDIHQENIFESKNFITEDALKNSNAKYLPVGSVLIALNGQGKTRGTVAQLKIKSTCNQSLVSINSKDHNVIKNEFLFYYLKSQYKKIRKLTGDSGNDRRGLNMKIINSMLIKFPEISVQKKVVDNCNSLTEINKNLTKILDNKMNKYAELKNSILNKEFSYE